MPHALFTPPPGDLHLTGCEMPSRPETREMHLILTPGLDILQRLLCSEFALRMDMFVEGSIKISPCV